MKSIILTGPESSGKTTLAESLSSYFQVPFVKEYAREYLEEFGPDYTFEEVLKMLEGQEQLENNAFDLGADFIICDTDVLTYKIWISYKYGMATTHVDQILKEKKACFYLLCSPDIPWVDDPLREHPKQRWELFDQYKEALEDLGLPYQILEGSHAYRMNVAKESIQQFI